LHSVECASLDGHDRTITVILAKHSIKLPDVGSLVMGNMLEHFTFIVPCNIVIVSKNNQHDGTCGPSFIFMGSRHTFFTYFEHSGSSSSGDHFSVQSASGIVYNLCCNPPVLLRVLFP